MDISQNFGKGASNVPDDFLKPEALRHEEVAGAFAPATWKEKALKDFVTYPKRNQGQTEQCVEYVLAKQLAVDELSENNVWRELSPGSIYPYVFILNGGGSNVSVAENVALTQGMTLEHLLPTDGLSEQQAENNTEYATDAKQVALVYKPNLFIQCAANFETIASILQYYQQQGKKKVIGVIVVGQNNGTWATSFPTTPAGTAGLWYHRLSVTDFGLINGKKHLSVDNSWGIGIGFNGQQFLPEEYTPYMYGASYTLNQPDDWQQSIPAVVKPKHTWNVNLQVGMSGIDILVLQQALQSLGMFPISSLVKPTGFFGGITKAGVMEFQGAFGFPATGIVDLATRDHLNSLFAG